MRACHVAARVAARRHMIRPEERALIIPVVDRSNNSPTYIIAFGATAVERPHQLKPSNRRTHILPGLESRIAGLSKGQSSRRGRSFFVVPRCKLHTCSGWLRVCCWAVMCCVRAGHVAAGVATRRLMIRPEERVLYQ